MKPISERFVRLIGLGLAVLLSGLVPSAQATPRLALSYIRGFPAATVEVPLTLRYGTNDLRDVVGLQADVTFSGGQVGVGWNERLRCRSPVWPKYPPARMSIWSPAVTAKTTSD